MNISIETLLAFGKLKEYEQKILAVLLDGPFYGSFGDLSKTMGFPKNFTPHIHKCCHHLMDLGIVEMEFKGNRLKGIWLPEDWEEKLKGE